MSVFRYILLFIALIVLVLLFIISAALFLFMLVADLYSCGCISDCFMCRDRKKGACKTCRYRDFEKED